MISTIHDGKYTHKKRGHNEISIPHMIEEYNKNKNGVDISNQNIAYYECIRGTHKWWKRLFYHLIDVCVENSRIIHKQAVNENI